MDLRQFANDIKRRSELLAEVVSASKSLLWNSPHAIEHLNYIQGRLTNKEIKKYNVGWFPSNNNINILFDYISEATVNELNLVYDYMIKNRGHFDLIKRSFFHFHNLIIPLIDDYGNIITLAGRTIIDEDEQKNLKIKKYKNAPFKKQLHLFGLNEASKTIESKDSVIIVEGQFDCIKCHQIGLLNTVALTGSDLSMQQIFILKRKTNNFYLLMDNDKAGERAVEKVIKNYSKFINIKTIKLPKQYNDVDSFIVKSTDKEIKNNFQSYF